MKDQEMITIAYSKPAKSVSVIGNFPSYNNKIKLNHNAQSDKTFSINLYLAPGKYHYKFVVDNTETVEYGSPIEIINGEQFNMITVKDRYKDGSSQSLSKFRIEELIEIDQRIMTLEEESLFSKKPDEQPDPFPDTGNLIQSPNNKDNVQLQSYNHVSQKSKSIIDYSNSFSIKMENIAHDYNNQMFESNQNENREDKVIVYNIADDFLIQMIIIKEGITDAHYAKFHYVEKDEDIIIHKNDVFYQPIDSFDTNGNFADLKIINELSLLKNMQMRIASNYNISFIQDIMILFNKEESNKRKFFISEFIRNDYRQNEAMTVLYKNNFVFPSEGSIDDGTVYDFFSSYIKLNYWSLYQKFESLFEKLFDLFKINMRYLYHFSFNPNINDDNKENSCQCEIGFTFLPLFPSNCLTNVLYEKNILLNNAQSSISLSEPINEALFNLGNTVIDKEIANELSKLELRQSLSTQQIKSYFQEVYSKFSIVNTNILNEIYSLLIKINLKHHYAQCLKFVLIAYIATNYQSVFNVKLSSLLRIDSKLIQNVKGNNLMFYSNVVILALLNYINHLLEFQLKRKKTEKEQNDTTHLSQFNNSNLLLFFNSGIKEDDILINEVIRQRISATQSLYASNINSISKFIKLYTNDNLVQFEQSLSSYDTQMINIIENIYDLTFLKDLFKAKFKKIKLLEIFKLASGNSLDNFALFELNAKSIRQLWLIDPGVTYDDFFSTQEKIVEFLQLTQIVEYASYYRIRHSYFREYSYEQFFKFYLPILSDIDNKFNCKKISVYKTLIKNFISDLQTFQGINEVFEVNDTVIKLDYRTFETMMLLLKNIKDEKALVIQKIFKGKVVQRLITMLKQYAITIQRYYKSKMYNKMKKLTQEQLASFLINKYLHSDPIIIKLILNSQKRISNMIEENNALQSAIEAIKRMKTESNVYSNTYDINSISNALFTNMTSVKSSKNFTFNQEQKEEVERLKTQLKESRVKFKDLVVTIAEYEKKMENFVKMINANREVKEVLYKNGIKIN